jgi:uncharacterized membrane protein YbhN (UPF0104 family)
MTIRRVLLLLSSTLLGVVLILLLIRGNKVDIAQIWHQLQKVSWISFGTLVALNGAVAYLSTEKWRCVDSRLRRPTDSKPRWRESFALTGIGMALGLVLPVQLGMVTARTIGTFFRGRALPRGAGGTLFEQSFDLLTVLVFTIASAITLLFKGKALMWTGCAAALSCLVLIAAVPTVRLIGLLLFYLAKVAPKNGRVGPALRSLSDQQGFILLSAGICRRLFVLSVIRFGVVVLMAYQTAYATGAKIPLWQLAAAVPLVTIAAAVAITPGALGISEFTFASVLALFGTPLSVSVPWTLAYRVLGTAACFSFAILSTIGLVVERAAVAPVPGNGGTAEL